MTFVPSAFDILIFPKHLWDRHRKTTPFYDPREREKCPEQNLDVMGVCTRKVNIRMLPLLLNEDHGQSEAGVLCSQD